MKKSIDKFLIRDYIVNKVPNKGFLEVEIVEGTQHASYDYLKGKIAERGIKKNKIAQTLGVSARALYNKLEGETPFTWPEVCKLQRTFFPDIEKDVLLSCKYNPSACQRK